MQDSKSIYDEFKNICPNSREGYNPTPANVQRWKWHIRQRRAPVVGTAFVVPESWLEYVERTRCETWADFPNFVKAAYLELTSFYPGVQLYACGSRVEGGAVDMWSEQRVRVLREAAGRSNKLASDFDYIAPGTVSQPDGIPGHFDRVRTLPPGEHKIAIPMWDFTKLPKEEHARVIQHLRLGEFRELARIHNEYNLSPWKYCCQPNAVLKWFQHGVDKGFINADTTTEQRG